MIIPYVSKDSQQKCQNRTYIVGSSFVINKLRIKSEYNINILLTGL